MQVPIPVEIDLYRVLGVPVGADSSTIKRAWRQLAAKYHPDVQQQRQPRDKKRRRRSSSPISPTGPTSPTERFLAIQEAYCILSNPERRQEYDRQRRDWIHRQQVGVAMPIDFPSPFPSTPISPPGYAGAALGDILDEDISVVSAPRAGRRGAISNGLLWVARHVCSWELFVRVRVLAGASVLLATLLVLHVLGPRGQTHAEDPFMASNTPATPGEAANGQSTISNPVPPPAKPPIGRAALRTDSARSKARQEMHGPQQDRSETLASSHFRARLNASRTDSGSARQSQNFSPSTGRGRSRTLAQSTGSTAASAALGVSPARAEDVHDVPSAAASQVLQSEARNITGSLSVHHELGVWDSRWLAGCLHEEQVFLGSLHLMDTQSRFEWRSWEGASPGGVMQSALAPHPSASVNELSLLAVDPGRSQNEDKNPGVPTATLSRNATSATLRFIGSSTGEMPCRKWYLVPVAAASRIAGRWLLPDRSRRKKADREVGNDVIPADYLELHLRNGTEQLSGRITTRYDVGDASIPPTVELSFAAPKQEFYGTFLWENASHGRGSVMVVPISSNQLAVRWQTDTLIPGKVQLTGGAALLRRR